MTKKKAIELLRDGVKGVKIWNKLTSQASGSMPPPRPVDLRGIDLSSTRLRGVDLSGADLRGAVLSDSDLRDANLRRAILIGANLRDANLSGADMRDVDLSDRAILSRADLRNADLSGAILFAADLRNAVLSGALMSGAYLRDADLSCVDLRDATLVDANMRDANLTDARLSGANLSGLGLNGAILRGADLSNANLENADLSDADLSGAKLLSTKLTSVNVSNANFTNARIGDSTIACDLSRARGLDQVRHDLPSVLSIWSILSLRDELPEGFLRGCGIAEEEIAHFRGRIGSPIRFYTCFISYSTNDECFATRLHNDFQAEGIRCWKWNLDARTGRPLWGEIDQAIRRYDKLLLVASESSLNSPPVLREIERALQQEDQRAKHKLTDPTIDADVLFPVCTDTYLFKQWDHERKADVTRKVIADACGWDKNNDKYAQLLTKLVRDLRPDTPPQINARHHYRR